MPGKTETGSEINLIAAGTTFEGKLRTPGSIRIDGRIVGEITATQAITLGNGGEIEGNITGKSVTIGGKINGTIIAQEKLVFEGKAVVHGDIRAAKLVIDEGAQFDGRCSMTETRPPVSMPPDVKLDVRKAEERR